ncbi:glycosyl hydrolase family 28-related protein, partial [Paenibacillus polymyxa]
MQLYNIVDYGAVQDGTTMATEAIAAAIEAASNAGGGTVFV